MEPYTTSFPLEISEGGTWNSFQPEVDTLEQQALYDPDSWEMEDWHGGVGG